MDHVSLDGVMQGPGRADEDARDGFRHSGWATPRTDEVIGQALGERMATSGGLLFGRRTYEDLLGHWNSVPDSPFAEPLNAATKYVATTHPNEPLPWPNSIALPGSSLGSSEVSDAVSDLRGRDGGDLGIMGSSVLVHTLQRCGLIDEYLLMIHPIVLGTGIRLFADGASYQQLRLVEPVRTSTTGVLVAVYRPDDSTTADGTA